jgi:hypothetical protein
MAQSYNPGNAETLPVWANSRSLATTCEIIVIFFSSAYLDVSVQRVVSYLVTLRLGFPIRKSTDQRLSAPPRSLSQLGTSFFVSETQGIPHILLVT